MALTPFNESNFEVEVLKSSTPVLVDFMAAWCATCRAIAPTVEGLTATYGDKVKIGKLNIDENPTVASQFNVQSIPTLVLFQNGKALGQLAGASSREKIDELLKLVL